MTRNHRRGTMTLLLVLVLMLAVLAAVTTTTRTAVSTRRIDAEQSSVRRLESAIEAVAIAKLETSSVIRLPLDPDRDRWIEVQTIQPTVSSPASSIASDSSDRWLKGSEVSGKRVVRSINRPVKSAPNHQPPQ